MNFFDGLSFSQADSRPHEVSDVRNEPVYYSIQFNYHGGLHLKINGVHEYDVEGPYAFLTYPGTVFEYGSVNGAPRHHNFICAYGERVNRYVESGLFPCPPDAPLVRIRKPEHFLQTMLSIMALIRQPAKTSPRAVLLFEDLLLQMHEDAQDEVHTRPYQSDCLNELMRNIGDCPERRWNFRAEAERCHVTLTHFRRLFKQLSGMPPQQFLIHARLRKGAELLISTNLTVKEIAAQIGMENVFYFSRLFALKFQASPGTYRREFGRT